MLDLTYMLEGYSWLELHKPINTVGSVNKRTPTKKQIKKQRAAKKQKSGISR